MGCVAVTLLLAIAVVVDAAVALTERSRLVIDAAFVILLAGIFLLLGRQIRRHRLFDPARRIARLVEEPPGDHG